MFERLPRRRLEGELSDGELHRAALAGSGEAMAALYQRHGGLVYRFTLQMSRDVPVAEEITQEVFLRCLPESTDSMPGAGPCPLGSAGLPGGSSGSVCSKTKRRTRSTRRTPRNWNAPPMARQRYCCGMKPWLRCEPE